MLIYVANTFEHGPVEKLGFSAPFPSTLSHCIWKIFRTDLAYLLTSYSRSTFSNFYSLWTLKVTSAGVPLSCRPICQDNALVFSESDCSGNIFSVKEIFSAVLRSDEAPTLDYKLLLAPNLPSTLHVASGILFWSSTGFSPASHIRFTAF